MRVPLLRLLAAALALSCAKGAERPQAPLEALHFPAWLATSGDRLLAVNLDQDLAFQGGSIVALDTAGGGVVPGGVPLPYMAGRMRVVDEDDTAAGCTFGAAPLLAVPFAMVPGHSEESLHFVGLSTEGPDTLREKLDLHLPGAARPYEAALTCAADGTPRAWVSYQRGFDDKGYVAQVDLSTTAPTPPVVQVFTGKGSPRSFAWDREHDRLYFTSTEFDVRSPIRWIAVGNGCKSFPGGVQDEREGGCHVDPGFDLSSHLAGAEPNGIALSSGPRPCVYGEAGTSCRRMYLTVRMYDADLARAFQSRPAHDVGGKLVVLELAESGLGGPEARWIDDVDIGKIAGDVLVIPRAGGDVVVATALDDDLVWIWDDARGTVAKVFGRLATGVPELGHKPAGLASRDMGGGIVRVFVASYEDHWVSAFDVPVADPAQAQVVRGTDGSPLRLGRPR